MIIYSLNVRIFWALNQLIRLLIQWENTFWKWSRPQNVFKIGAFGHLPEFSTFSKMVKNYVLNLISSVFDSESTVLSIFHIKLDFWKSSKISKFVTFRLTWPFSDFIFSLNKQPVELVVTSKDAVFHWINSNVLFAMRFKMNYRFLFNYLKRKRFMLKFCLEIFPFLKSLKSFISLNKQQEKLILRSKDAHIQWVNNPVLVDMKFKTYHILFFNFLKRERFTFKVFSKIHHFSGFFEFWKMQFLCKK